MAINMDAVKVQPSLLGRIDRKQNDVRQGGWLHQLEQAWLEEGAQPDADSGRERAPAAVGGAHHPPAVHAGRTAAATGQTAPAAGAAFDGVEAAVPRQLSPLLTGIAAAPADSRPQAAAATTATQSVARQAGVAGTMTPAAPSPPQLSAMLSQPAAQAVNALAAYAQAVGPVQPPTATDSAADDVVAASPNPGATSGPGLSPASALDDAGRSPSTQVEVEVEVREDTPEPTAHPEPVDDYASRLLHVYHGADGVQAWVRDLALAPEQVQGLAQLMAAELSGAGTRLAALTVNGKKLALPAGDQQDDYLPRTEGSDGAQTLTTITNLQGAMS